MKRGIIVVSIVLMVLAMFGMIQASLFETTMKLGVGVSFLPFWMSALLMFLALILLINVLRGREKCEDKPVFNKEGILKTVFLAIVLIFYLILLEILGYFVSTFLFFFITIFILNRSHIIRITFWAAMFTFLLFAVFKWWLKSPLPTGLIGI
ncbi:MAG: tripartite tricarboxylate transporter TctB family protein [Thermodesulfobacteriota bacterium]|nr:tripartite tricarboxylate transporter TctB family protein [Thermodesulfobacteriota bacterium]